MPPPSVPAELSSILQFDMIGRLLSRQLIAPPAPLAELLLNLQPSITGLLLYRAIAPPFFGETSTLAAVLFSKIQFSIVGLL